MAKAKATAKRLSRKDGTTYQVFVSHATSDKWIARIICEKIEKVGATTFRDDRDIDGGDDIPEKIRSQIVRSKELVVLLTPDSITRPWVLLEVGAAWGQKHRIIAVLCHVGVRSIPEILKPKKVLYLSDFDSYLDELAGRLTGRGGK